jgi:hypothetical protein
MIYDGYCMMDDVYWMMDGWMDGWMFGWMVGSWD